MIAGLDAAVGSMRTGEKSEFIISPGLAYGSRGCPPRIPCQAYVYFKVLPRVPFTLWPISPQLFG